jgi:adenylate cyclase class 2
VNGPREVEVKYRVLDVERLETALHEHGLFLSRPFTQDDQAYAEGGWDYGMSKIGVAFARLRTQNSRHLFTVKKPVDNEMSCLEYECEVSDRDQMHHAILAMGFTPTVRIVKQRRVAHDGPISLCLDDVQHIGVFVEFERLLDPGQPTTHVQAQLDQLARSFNIPLEPTTQTYDSLVRAALITT